MSTTQEKAMATMTQDQTTAMLRALFAVRGERERQHARFGEQDLPDGTGEGGYFEEWLISPFESAADVADTVRGDVAAALKDGSITFAHVLAEEFFEALAETDPARLRAELVQVAAVAVQWIEAIDRRAARSEVANGR